MFITITIVCWLIVLLVSFHLDRDLLKDMYIKNTDE
jgi:hypothetical protein